MNTVDPGYMSTAPEIRARVLWTVAVSKGKKNKQLGPKHFGTKEAIKLINPNLL